MSKVRQSSKSISPNRRVQRTREELQAALMALTLERGFDRIRVHDIVERARVSRATFYLHYKDKDELLFAGMQRIYDELSQSATPVTREDLNGAAAGELREPTDFRHVAQYADFYRVMLSERSAAGFLRKLEDYLARGNEGFLGRLIPSGQHPPIPLDAIARYVAAAQLGLTRWWLENDMPCSPEQMAQVMYHLTGFGVWWCMAMGDVPRPPLPELPPLPRR